MFPLPHRSAVPPARNWKWWSWTGWPSHIFTHSRIFVFPLWTFYWGAYATTTWDSELIETWLKRSQLICIFDCQRWTSAELTERIITEIPPKIVRFLGLKKIRIKICCHGLWWVSWIWTCLYRVSHQLSEWHSWEVCGIISIILDV